MLLASAVAGFLLYQGLAGGGFGTQARPAPEFTLPDLDGVARSSDEWDGDIRVVNFWATWCPPCIREIPLLVEIQDEYRDRGVTVIGIAVDETEAVAEFAADFAFNYPVVVGQEEAMNLAQAYAENFIGLPFTAFTDRAGRIRHIHTGEIHRAEIEEILSRLL
nr:TlpA disulfide reductase family protein [Thioalkalivibrio sp. XN279]